MTAATTPKQRTFASFLLRRIALFPYQRLLELRPPRTTTAVHAALRAQLELEARRERLAEALHALVPAQNNVVRRQLLNAKRAVHNVRLSGQDVQCLTELPMVPEPVRAAVREWAAIQAEARHALDDAELALRSEQKGHVRKLLHALSRDEAFLRPLSIASPSFLVQWLDELKEARTAVESTKRERAALAYLIRAAAKTSPLSTFMRTELIGEQKEGPDVRDAPWAGVSRSALALLYTGALTRPGDREHARWSFGHLERITDELFAVRSTSSRSYFGKGWRSEQAMRLRVPAAVGRALQQLPVDFSWAHLSSCLAATGLSAATAQRYATRLVDAGHIRLKPYDDGAAKSPAEALRLVLAKSEAPSAQITASALGDLTAAVASLPELSGSLRARKLLEARASFQSALRYLKSDNPSAQPVFENGSFAIDQTTAWQPYAWCLTELCRVFQKRLILSPSAVHATEHFVKRFGRAGQCGEVLQFLDLLASQPLDLSSAATLTTNTTPLIALFQLARSRESASPLIVVNHVFPGATWVSARWSVGPGEASARFGALLRGWVTATSEGAEPVEVTTCGDCNDLQVDAALTSRVLEWPGEPRPNRDSINLRQTTLIHDAKVNTLRLCGPLGEPLLPVYAGGTMPTPAWGARFWLLALSMRGNVQPPSLSLPDFAEPDVVYPRPRMCEGHVVWHRANWWLSSERLRRLWFSSSGAKQLLAVKHDLHRLGMPDIAYIRARFEPQHMTTTDAHKPLWFDAMNPLCLEMLHAICRETSWVCFTEALPASDTAWEPDAPEPSSTEYLAHFFVPPQEGP